MADYTKEIEESMAEGLENLDEEYNYQPDSMEAEKEWEEEDDYRLYLDYIQKYTDSKYDLDSEKQIDSTYEECELWAKNHVDELYAKEGIPIPKKPTYLDRLFK